LCNFIWTFHAWLKQSLDVHILGIFLFNDFLELWPFNDFYF
jgi:hypothetical protein